MPGSNKIGPMGAGARTGRGPHPCENADNAATGWGRGVGMGCRHGFGHGAQNFSARFDMTADNCLEALQLCGDMLQTRLAQTDKQLETL